MPRHHKRYMHWLYTVVITTLVCCLFTMSLEPIAYGQDADISLVLQEAKTALQKIGFDERQFEVRESKGGNLKLTLLRAKFDRRVYDISFVSDSQFYLSVSYNYGKTYGKITRFSRLASAVQVIENIEKREKLRVAQQRPEGNPDSQQKDTGQSSSAANNGNTASEESKNSKSPSAALAAAVDSVAQGGTAAATERAKEDSEKEAKKYSSEFSAGSGSSDPCTGSGLPASVKPVSSDGDAGGSSGLAGTAKQIGEAAIATGLAEAFAATSSGIGKATGVDQANHSSFFKDSDGQLSVDELADELSQFSSSSAAQKERLLRSILVDLSENDGKGISKNFRAIQNDFERFKRWASSEGVNERSFLKIISRLSRLVSMDVKRFQAIAGLYPQQQQLTFYAQWQDVRIWLDPELPNIEAAMHAFVYAAMFFVRATIVETNQAMAVELKQQVDDLNELMQGVFSTDKEALDKARQRQRAVFKETERTRQAMINLLEERAFDF